MAAEIEEATGQKSELVAGGGGIFDVERDGELLYTKAKTGRFPHPGEIANLLKSK